MDAYVNDITTLKKFKISITTIDHKKGGERKGVGKAKHEGKKRNTTRYVYKKQVQR